MTRTYEAADLFRVYKRAARDGWRPTGRLNFSREVEPGVKEFTSSDGLIKRYGAEPKIGEFKGCGS